MGDATKLNRKAIVHVSSCQCESKVNFNFVLDGINEHSKCVYELNICLKNFICFEPNSETSPLSSLEAISPTKTFGKLEKQQAREDVKQMFIHAYDNYMKYAFPEDELLPLSCDGTHIKLTAGKMLTLVDSLDTLAIMGNKSEFHRAILLISSAEKSLFRVDVTVSVFESTIRVLGGLLSAHLILTDRTLDFFMPSYNGALLRMAKDLGDRLLPAFETATKLPFGTVNLEKGVRKKKNILCFRTDF